MATGRSARLKYMRARAKRRAVETRGSDGQFARRGAAKKNTVRPIGAPTMCPPLSRRLLLALGAPFEVVEGNPGDQ
jgi:hypothetical protein